MSGILKIPCVECGVMILLSTAEKNNGLCMPCKSGMRGSIEKRKIELAQAKDAKPEPEFICLECGSKKLRSEMHANTTMNSDDPWSLASSRVECWECGAVMPRELARRWNVDLEQAKLIWKEKFRDDIRSRVKNA